VYVLQGKFYIQMIRPPTNMYVLLGQANRYCWPFILLHGEEKGFNYSLQLSQKKKTLQLALHLQTAADIVVVGSNNVAEPAAPLLALLKRAPRSQGVARPLVPRRRWILISQKNSLMQAARSTKDRPAKRKRREMTRWRG